MLVAPNTLSQSVQGTTILQHPLHQKCMDTIIDEQTWREFNGWSCGRWYFSLDDREKWSQVSAGHNGKSP